MKIQFKKIKKILRIIALSIFAFVAITLVIISLLCLVLRFDFAENYLRDVGEDYLNSTLSPYQMSIQIDRLELALPFAFHAYGVKLDDLAGTFADVEKISFLSNFFSLLRYEIVVPEIGLINTQITKLPHLIFPVTVEKKEEKEEIVAFSQINQVLTGFAESLFHPNMPTVRFSKIHVENLLVNSNVVNQIKTLNEQSIPLNLPQENISNHFDELHINFIADASLDKSLFRIASFLEIGVDTGVPMTLNASLDLFKFKKIRSRIQYNDSEGVLLYLAKEILALPHSKKAYASFNMEGSGSFDDFSMDYNADIFDDMYLSKLSTVKGELGIIPPFATINTHVFPKVLGTINHGDVKFNAAAHLLLEEKKAIESNNSDEKSLKNSSIQKEKEKEVRNIQVKYDFTATSMDFVSSMIQGLLGNKQTSKGQLNLVFSKNAHPYAESDDIYFESKNIKANARLFFSRKIDLHAQASIHDLSALGSKVQNVSGRAEGKVALTGDIGKLFLDARFEVPILKVQMLGGNDTEIFKTDEENIKNQPNKNDKKNKKSKKDKKDTKNKKVTEEGDFAEESNLIPDNSVIELKSFVFALKSANNIQQKQMSSKNSKKTENTDENKNKKKSQTGRPLIKLGENDEAVYLNTTSKNISPINNQNAYALQVKEFYQLFLQSERKALPFILDLQAQYNNQPISFSSQIVLGAGLLGKEGVKSRDLEINNLMFKGLGSKIQGNMRSSWDASDDYFADFDFMPLLQGKVEGLLENAEALSLTLNQPIAIDNAAFKWVFSVDKLKKDEKLAFSSKKYSGSQKMHWQFSATSLTYNTYIFQNNSMDFTVQNLWVSPYIKGLAQIKDLDFASNKSKNWILKVDGSLLDLNVETSFSGDTSLLFKGIVGIDRKKNDLFLDMHTLDFTHSKSQTDIRLKQKGQLRLSEKEFIANKVHFKIAPKGEIQLNGELRPEHVALDGWWKDIDLKYLPVGYGGYLFGKFNFSGTSTNPAGSLEMRLKDFRAPGYPPISLDVKGAIFASNPIHKLLLTLSIVDKDLLGIKDAEIKVDIPMESKPWLRIARTRPIEGIVKYDGTLGALWSYVPLEGRKLIGYLFVDGKVSGTVIKPFVTLNANVKKAYYQDIILGISLQDIDAQLSLDPYGQGKLLFSTRDNESGTMSLQGDIVVPWLSHGRYQAPVKITGNTPSVSERKRIKMWEKSIAILDLSSNIQNFKPLQRSDVEVSLTGDIKITGMITDPTILGYIRVNEGKVQLENIQGSSIPELNIVKKINDKFQRRQRTIGKLDFTLDIPNQFYVLGPGIETEWKGKLAITGKVNQPKVVGSISAIDGKMNLLDRDFSLVKGEVDFNGSTPITPLIDLQLGYKAQGLDAKIGISGSVETPKLELTSVPYLPEDEILSRILFFSSVSDLSAYEKIRLAGMLTNLAGFSLKLGVADLGRKFFGLDVIRVGSGSGTTSTSSNSDDDENISVELGKYIRDNVYVGVEQGLTDQETVGITNYEINNNLSVGGQVGTEDAEVHLEWKLDY